MSKHKNALVLSGGGSRGAYQIGVWQALRETGFQPHIVTGTSVGAINGAMVAQDAFEQAADMWKELETHMVFDLEEPEEKTKARHKRLPFSFDFDLELGGLPAADLSAYAKNLLTKGGTGASALKSLLREFIDEAAVRGSQVEYGLVTAQLPAMTPCHLFLEQIPKGELIDYILASASCFPAVKACAIGDTKFIDGGYADNMPVGMALERGADTVIAVDLEAVGVVPHKPLEEAGPRLLRIDCPWDLGNFLVFDGKNAARIMRLGYLDALKALDYFDGRLYAFARGSMPKRLLPLGEQAGKLFGLDPSLLYTRETFNKRLAEAAILHEKETEQEMESLSHNLKNPAALLESLPKALRSINGKTVCLLLHHYMQAHPEKITLPRALKSLAKPQLDAALYLLREGLLRVGL